mgnify:FL=1
MDIEILLNFNYEHLKKYLLNASDDERKKVLSDDRIKNKLINSDYKYDFVFLSQEDSDIVLYLLNGNGVNLLKESLNCDINLNSILTSTKEYVNKLFNNDEFVNLVIENIKNKRVNYYYLNNNLANLLYNKIEKKDKINLIGCVSGDAQLYIIKNNEIAKENFWEALVKLQGKAAQLLINKVNYKLSFTDISLIDLYNCSKKELSFPHYMFEEKKFISNISDNYDINYTRFIINNFSKYNDLSSIEKSKKEILNDNINTLNNELLPKYEKLYMILDYLIKNDKLEYDTIKESIYSIFENESNIFLQNLNADVISCLSSDNKNELLDFLKKESNVTLGNLIIDFHFKDHPLNVKKDINELVSFEKSGGNTISKEDLTLYEQILNIDNLSCSEKVNLHQKLSQINMVEKFYDDIRNAKNKMYENINNAILKKDNIGNFKNNELSNKYGVNIYTLEGTPFYALVKSVGTLKGEILSEVKLHSRKDGGSFSIDSGYKLNTFNKPNYTYNLAYDGFSSEQVVHAYTEDSYSNYDRNSEDTTPKINKIMMPYEFVTESPYYNELVISQVNEKKTTEMDDKIPMLKPFAIYCYDEICANDIESAKRLGLDIILINTKKYNVNIQKKDENWYKDFKEEEYVLDPIEAYKR